MKKGKKYFVRIDYKKSDDKANMGLIQEHINYLINISKERFSYGGAFVDSPGGMIIFEADNKEEAEKLCNEDPIIKSGFYGFNLYDWELKIIGENYKLEEESIFIRRSIRKYADKKVESEKIELLLRAAMQAPSAHNQQPWEFLIVKEKETLKKISECHKYSKMTEKAGCAIIVLGNKDYLNIGQFWQQDLAAATQNLLLKAAELELGAVWIGIAPMEKEMSYLSNLFKLPDNILPFNIISIGYPEPPRKNKFKDRFDKNKIHYEKW